MNKTVLFLLLISLISCVPKELKAPTDMNRFEKFILKEKFVTDNNIFYPGLANQEMKGILTEKINQAANDFKIVAISNNPTDEKYQEQIKIGLNRFSDLYVNLDTEDRERICLYFEELMDIVGLQSSAGLLNDFMYDFDPN